MDSQDVILKSFGERLRLVRERRGISQERLALACGMDRTYVSAVDRGRQNITIVNMYRLAEALNVSPHIFLLPNEDFDSALDSLPMKGIKVGRRPKLQSTPETTGR